MRTSLSLTSLCLGTAVRRLRSGFIHQEWLPPSRIKRQPFVSMWRIRSVSFNSDAYGGLFVGPYRSLDCFLAIEFNGFLECDAKRF